MPWWLQLQRWLPTRPPSLEWYELSPEAERAIRALAVTRGQLRSLHRGFCDMDQQVIWRTDVHMPRMPPQRSVARSGSLQSSSLTAAFHTTAADHCG